MKAMIKFYGESQKGKLSNTTIANAQEVLERIFRQMEKYGVAMEDRRITGLNGEVLQRWQNSVKEGHKAATVNQYVCMLNPFLKWASTMSYEDDNGNEVPYVVRDYSKIVHTIPLPKEEEIPEWERPKDKYYTKEQVAELFNGSHGYHKVRDQAIMALILGSGLRVSEVCSLTIGSIRNHEHGFVYVKRKGGAWKEAPVAEFVYEYLEKYLSTRKDKDDMNAPLFMTERGNACSRKQVWKSLSEKQKEFGLATGAHALRHTFISESEKVGGGAVARDLANHKSLTITNRYDHSTKEQRVSAINNLNWFEGGK